MPLNINCSNDKFKEMIIAEYTIELKDGFIIYGIDINKILNKKFPLIEKELNSKTKVDEEVSVIFISKAKDFIVKSINTEDKDEIDIKYGPVEDSSVYRRYEDIIPYSIEFYGGVSVHDKQNTKNSVIKELKKNLPDNDLVKKVLNDIQNTFLEGDYKPGLIIRINFKMPKFPIAKLSIGFSSFYKDEIFYKYTFCRKSVLYPP